MEILYFLLLLGGLACFALMAFRVVRDEKVNLLALGLMLWILVPVIQMAQRL